MERLLVSAGFEDQPVMRLPIGDLVLDLAGVGILAHVGHPATRLRPGGVHHLLNEALTVDVNYLKAVDTDDVGRQRMRDTQKICRCCPPVERSYTGTGQLGAALFGRLHRGGKKERSSTPCGRQLCQRTVRSKKSGARSLKTGAASLQSGVSLPIAWHESLGSPKVLAKV
jgi:hypothetical protein